MANVDRIPLGIDIDSKSVVSVPSDDRNPLSVDRNPLRVDRNPFIVDRDPVHVDRSVVSR